VCLAALAGYFFGLLSFAVAVLFKKKCFSPFYQNELENGRTLSVIFFIENGDVKRDENLEPHFIVWRYKCFKSDMFHISSYREQQQDILYIFY
jgi:hypothetical protein